MKTTATKAKAQPTIDELKVLALTQFLGDNDQEEAQRLIDNDDYKVFTDEEADEEATEQIKQSLWACNADFIASHCGLPTEVIKAIQDNEKCEGNNEVIEDLINRLGDIDDFVSEAISADGRGHFMSSYDGNENEESVSGETFYIYRIN